MNKINKELDLLRGLSDEQLIQKKKELTKLFICTVNGALNPKFPPARRGELRRSIARINTIMGERGHRGLLKEERRLNG